MATLGKHGKRRGKLVPEAVPGVALHALSLCPELGGVGIGARFLKQAVELAPVVVAGCILQFGAQQLQRWAVDPGKQFLSSASVMTQCLVSSCQADTLVLSPSRRTSGSDKPEPSSTAGTGAVMATSHPVAGEYPPSAWQRSRRAPG